MGPDVGKAGTLINLTLCGKPVQQIPIQGEKHAIIPGGPSELPWLGFQSKARNMQLSVS